MGISLNSKLDWDCLQSSVTEADQNVAQLNLLLECGIRQWGCQLTIKMGLTYHV